MVARQELITSEQARRTLKRVELDKVSRADLIAMDLGQRVFGQDEAVLAVAKQVALAEAGLQDAGRPLGAFFELGPTGVGKTELARALAFYLTGNETRLLIINCAEFTEEHDAKRLIGSPPSYIGSSEVPPISHDWLHQEAEDKRVKSVIVFDEVEKAHPTLHKLFLSMLEEGRFSARKGSKGFEDLMFDASYIFFTSNVGSDEISTAQRGKTLGFHTGAEVKKAQVRDAAIDALTKQFKPEFLGRVGDDHILVFNPLTDTEYEKIFHKFLGLKNEQMHTLNPDAVSISTTQEFKAWILSGLKGVYGGREVREGLQNELISRAAEIIPILDAGSMLVADYMDGEVVFYTDKAEEVEEAVIPLLKAPRIRTRRRRRKRRSVADTALDGTIEALEMTESVLKDIRDRREKPQKTS
ncbi:MAG: AAA family ATPase [Candidatus Levyibacteriota bacterium]